NRSAAVAPREKSERRAPESILRPGHRGGPAVAAEQRRCPTDTVAVRLSPARDASGTARFLKVGDFGPAEKLWPCGYLIVKESEPSPVPGNLTKTFRDLEMKYPDLTLDDIVFDVVREREDESFEFETPARYIKGS
ncbi:Protein of unknown function, partial [Gryllus bimaculatus]